MRYYGMDLAKKTEEYNTKVAPQVAASEDSGNASEELVCPECHSKLEFKDGLYHCTNPECGQMYKIQEEGEEEEEFDFWDLNMASNANANGVGQVRGPEDIGLTQKQYNLTIAALLFYGFFINAVECIYLMHWVFSINWLVLLIGYLVTCMCGFYLIEKTYNPYVSFAGYNLVVLPVGLVLTRFLAHFDPYLIIDASFITATFTLMMVLVGTCFPRIFLDKGCALMTALGMVLLADLTCVFGFDFINPGVYGIFAAFVFSLFIAYDWSRAQQIEYTLDNAISVTVAMYLDIINLLMRVLEIMSKFKKR